MQSIVCAKNASPSISMRCNLSYFYFLSYFYMKHILEAIIKLLNKDQQEFTNLVAVRVYCDHTVEMEHMAINPERKVEVKFETVDECLNYLKQF